MVPYSVNYIRNKCDYFVYRLYVDGKKTSYNTMTSGDFNPFDLAASKSRLVDKWIQKNEKQKE